MAMEKSKVQTSKRKLSKVKDTHRTQNQDYDTPFYFYTTAYSVLTPLNSLKVYKIQNIQISPKSKTAQFHISLI